MNTERKLIQVNRTRSRWLSFLPNGLCIGYRNKKVCEEIEPGLKNLMDQGLEPVIRIEYSNGRVEMRKVEPLRK